MTVFESAAIAEVFSSYPATVRKKLLQLRTIIFEVAADTQGVGEIRETLKWGEPAYGTASSGSGSTIRIDRWKNADTEYALYFHCQTNLIETFRTLFPGVFRFEGNRSIVFAENDVVPVTELKVCIEMALTYHLAKRRSPAVASAHRNITSRSTRSRAKTRAPG